MIRTLYRYKPRAAVRAQARLRIINYLGIGFVSVFKLLGKQLGLMNWRPTLLNPSHITEC